MVEILLVITQDEGWVLRNEFVIMAFAISYCVFVPALHRESTNSLIGEHLLLCVPGRCLYRRLLLTLSSFLCMFSCSLVPRPHLQEERVW